MFLVRLFLLASAGMYVYRLLDAGAPGLLKNAILIFQLFACLCGSLEDAIVDLQLYLEERLRKTSCMLISVGRSVGNAFMRYGSKRRNVERLR